MTLPTRFVLFYGKIIWVILLFLPSQGLCAWILWLVWHLVIKILPFSVTVAKMVVPSYTDRMNISWFFFIHQSNWLIVTRDLITTEQTITFVMLLFHKGWCNFPRIIRQINHKIWDFCIMLLSFSFAIASPLLSDVLTVEEVNRKFQFPF